MHNLALHTLVVLVLISFLVSQGECLPITVSKLPTLAEIESNSLQPPIHNEPLPNDPITTNSHKVHQKHCVDSCFQNSSSIFAHDCQKAYQTHSFHDRCSISTIKFQCRHLCQKNSQFCKNICESKKCGCESYRSCQKVCFVGQTCRYQCFLEKLELCISDKITSNYHAQCRKVVRGPQMRGCLLNCGKTIPPATCMQKCHRYNKNHSNVHNMAKCSISFHKKQCELNCVHAKRVCKHTCKNRVCAGKTFTECAWKCTNGPKKCLSKCVWKLQHDCYQKRIASPKPYPLNTKCLRACVQAHPSDLTPDSTSHSVKSNSIAALEQW
jgi:hypothetical protein